MVCNENSDRLFKVMELKGVPLVAYCILHNYCLRNGLFFMPKMQVLVCRVKNAFLLGTIWRLDIVWADLALTSDSNFLLHRGWDRPCIITTITVPGGGWCKQIKPRSSLQMSCSHPMKWTLYYSSVLSGALRLSKQWASTRMPIAVVIARTIGGGVCHTVRRGPAQRTSCWSTARLLISENL